MANSYGFRPVPLSVDGGRHSGALLRLGTYASLGDVDGVVSPGDCKVHQLTVPGTQIVVDPGAVIVRNRSNEDVANQSYVIDAPLPSYLDAPDPSTQARSHLVIARIEDPEFEGWELPVGADPLTYQYAKPVIIENVGAGITSWDQYLATAGLEVPYSAYALARLDVPANTGTIIDAYCKNLRSLARPNWKQEVRGVNNSEQHTFVYNDLAWHAWPLAATWNIPIPRWANTLSYSLSLGQIVPVWAGAIANGYLRLNVGNGQILGDAIQWELDATNSTNPFSIFNADEYAIPSALRGTTQNFKVEARRLALSASQIRWHAVSSMAFTVTFEERVAV